MMTEPGYVRLQVLVRPEWRHERGLAEIEADLRALGFEVTGRGAATLSARATPSAYAAAQPMPAPLSTRIQSITVAPQHIVLGEQNKNKKQRGKT